MSTNGNHLRSTLLSGVAAIVLLIGLAGVVTQPAFAQNGQGQGASGQGQGGPPDEVGGEGEEEDSDGRGPQYGQPDEGEDRGGKPVWAQEGIPEVELGRLSVIRSPDQVLDRALAEVVANFDADTMSVYYELTATEFAYIAENSWDTITIIDSPLENLALLTELWTTGDTSLPGVDIPDDTNLIELSAIFIGVASDKNLPVSEDTIIALATVVGVTMSDSLIATIAEKAEDVRYAVYLGHG